MIVGVSEVTTNIVEEVITVVWIIVGTSVVPVVIQVDGEANEEWTVIIEDEVEVGKVDNNVVSKLSFSESIFASKSSLMDDKDDLSEVREEISSAEHEAIEALLIEAPKVEISSEFFTSDAIEEK